MNGEITTKSGGEASLKAHNQDRMRRAFSWLEKSKQDVTNHEQFIFLWIAFNAAYGAEAIGAEADSDRVHEVERFKQFLQEIVKRDERGEIKNIIWKTFSGPIRVLLKNKYVFRPFWEFVQGSSNDRAWRGAFKNYNSRVNYALRKNNIHSVLVEIFYRLYTLRNQIFHGGTTFAEGWGQSQLRDGSRIMASLVPVILTIMKADIDKNPDSEVWGKVAYPRINRRPDN